MGKYPTAAGKRAAVSFRALDVEFVRKRTGGFGAASVFDSFRNVVQDISRALGFD